MRRLLIITVLLTLGGAGVAQAAATGTMSLTPSTVSAGSGLAVAITGLASSGLPTSVDLQLQPGFAASAKSVSTLCPTSQDASCPSASQIGTGSVGISIFGSPTTVPLKIYLGDPTAAGDIASVILSGAVYGNTLTVSGRLFVPAAGGLELLLSGFPSLSVTLDALSISVQGSQTATKTTTRTGTKTVTKVVFTGKGKHRHKHKVKRKVKHKVTTTTRIVYSLITNPSTCTGMWTGNATFTYASGPTAVPLAAACTP
ncbi:MAG TPA: hypothetical protein VG294_12890 [Solirubrobacteraceae bacterium]|nr:hypothetical protein [Solirubrobacteraceae bacterium]